mgnify:FL=1
MYKSLKKEFRISMEKTQGITIDIQKKALQSYDRNAFVLEQS